jgi:5-methylcytosine-specific restriction protein A
MIFGKKDLIIKELEEGTGAAISVAFTQSGLRSGLKIWFGDLEEKQGPVAELRPYGLRGHRVELVFGRFSGPVIEVIGQAQDEDVQLARALLLSIGPPAELEIPEQDLTNWIVRSGNFRMIATIRHDGQLDEDAAMSITCREIIVPMMAAMAELIGYDVIKEEETSDETPAYEGAVVRNVVVRRERTRAIDCFASVSTERNVLRAVWNLGFLTERPEESLRFTISNRWHPLQRLDLTIPEATSSPYAQTATGRPTRSARSH